MPHLPLPKYKVSGIYKLQICRKLAARLRLIFAARLPQTRFSYANYFSGALFWHTMCAASMQRTVVAHCSGTQCAPQVCSAQLPHTVLAHNVRRKYAAHSCRALFWHTMCAVQVSLQRTVATHCTGTQCAPQVCSAQLSRTILAHNVRHTGKFAAHSCRTLFLCATTLRRTVAVLCIVLPPPLPPPSHPWFIIPTAIFFLVPYPQGECKKKCGDGRSVTKNKNLGVGVGKNVGAGDGRGYIKNKNLGVGLAVFNPGGGGWGWFDKVIAKKNWGGGRVIYKPPVHPKY